MRERMEMKAHTLGVALSTAWPMATALAIMVAAIALVLPLRLGWPLMVIMAAAVVLSFLWCFFMYLGTYVFLPATEYKGARIIARLGRNETEISGVLASEIIVKQGWIEKLCGVCHIRQKGTAIYLRGVQEPEKVKAWITANFPAERKAADPPKRNKRKSA